LKILFPPLRPPHSIEGDPSPPERGGEGGEVEKNLKYRHRGDLP
jgi:hypothetical protein